MFPGVVAEFDAHMTEYRLAPPTELTCLLSLLLSIVALHVPTLLRLLALTYRTALSDGYLLTVFLVPLCTLVALMTSSCVLEPPMTPWTRLVELALQTAVSMLL